MNLQNRNGFRDIENELTVAKGEGIVSKFGVDMYTWLYFKWIINNYCIAHGTLLKNVAAWMRAGLGRRMDTCIWMAESLYYSSQTVTTLLIGYTPIHNKKVYKY